jgi:uncharacterized protein
MQPAIAIADSEDFPLGLAPIPDAHVLAGRPVARNAILFQSADRLQTTFLWHCTAGTFRWFYEQDETLLLRDGGMTLHFDDGTSRSCAPGDLVFLAAGSTCVWEIPSHVRKLAILYRTVPRPIALPVRLAHKLISLSHVREISRRQQMRRTSLAPGRESAVQPLL